MSMPYDQTNYGINSYPPPVEGQKNHHHPSDSLATIQGYGVKNELDESRQYITRTPSPTPSEQADLSRSGAIDWKALLNWRTYARKDWIVYYILIVLIVALTIALTVLHTQIVNALKPATKWMHDLPFGWLIPIGILFVISFPPLFGHEIVAVLVGLTWGLGIGFAIVAAGTLLGEIGNFYAFKWCCKARGEKLAKTSILYAKLARVVQEGGFKIALIVRLSVIPGHLTTAVFAACGMGIFTFILAALLSMPKQFITVYIGVILEESSSSGGQNSKDKIISRVVLAVTIAVTIFCFWYILRKMNAVKESVIYDRRKARQTKTSGASPYGHNAASNDSESNIPLTASQSDNPYGGPGYYPSDSSSSAAGYSGNNALHAPVAQRRTDINLENPYPAQSSETVNWDASQSHYAPPPGLPSGAYQPNVADVEPYTGAAGNPYSHHQEPTATTYHTAAPSISGHSKPPSYVSGYPN